jgi:hypothetical protein
VDGNLEDAAMSYCRWSSDDFGCDVYVYESTGDDWLTHVARNRVLGVVPPTPPMHDDPAWIQQYMLAHQAQMAFLETAERAPIGLPHDGESFDDPTPGECADRLEQLRALGYRVPLYAIDALRAEQAELLTMHARSRNRREGRFRGRQRGKHWRSQAKWLKLVYEIGETARRMPGGILPLTHVYLASRLAAIRVINHERANDAALEVVRYVMDVIPDNANHAGHPLSPEFERVVTLIETWERKNYPFDDLREAAAQVPGQA